MPFGIEEYCGYTIHWDTSSSPNANLWKARAALVSPADNSGFPIHGITGDRFKSAAEARDYVLSAAKQWVDDRLGGSSKGGEPLVKQGGDYAKNDSSKQVGQKALGATR